MLFHNVVIKKELNLFHTLFDYIRFSKRSHFGGHVPVVIAL